MEDILKDSVTDRQWGMFWPVETVTVLSDEQNALLMNRHAKVSPQAAGKAQIVCLLTMQWSECSGRQSIDLWQTKKK